MVREILILGAFLGAKYYFSEEEKQAQENWQNKQQETQKTLEEHQKFIDDNKKNAQESIDFHYLTEMHYSSMLVSNDAYSLLKDARKTLNGIGQLLGKSSKHKKLLQEQIKAKNVPNKKNLKDELEALNKMRKGLFNERNLIKDEQDTMLKKVQKINGDTATLKLHIKERCGRDGADWFERMEYKKNTGKKMGKQRNSTKHTNRKARQQPQHNGVVLFNVISSLFK